MGELSWVHRWFGYQACRISLSDRAMLFFDLARSDDFRTKDVYIGIGWLRILRILFIEFFGG
jgi:hypothetical protein